MAGLDDLLTQALNDIALDAPDLPPLPPRTRRRIALGRLRTLLTGTVVIAGTAAVVAIAVTQATRVDPPGPPTVRPGWMLRGLGSVEAVAASRSAVYVAVGDYPSATLSAFDLATGKLIHRVSVPGLPVALRVGPGGSVWLTFGVDRTGSRSGLWRLSADLRRRTAATTRQASALQLSDVLPIGPFDAVVAGRDLMDVHVGEGGLALHQIASLPTGHGFSGPVVVSSVLRLGGRFAVLENSNSAKYRIVVAGRNGAQWPAWKYGPALLGLTSGRNPVVAIDSVASSDHGLWIVIEANGSPTRAVVRLSERLNDVTPFPVRFSTLLASAEQVWTGGQTVVASTMDPDIPLACFSQNGPGPLTKIPARLPPTDVSVVGDAVYAADALGVTVYYLPAACRQWAVPSGEAQRS